MTPKPLALDASSSATTGGRRAESSGGSEGDSSLPRRATRSGLFPDAALDLRLPE